MAHCYCCPYSPHHPEGMFSHLPSLNILITFANNIETHTLSLWTLCKHRHSQMSFSRLFAIAVKTQLRITAVKSVVSLPLLVLSWCIPSRGTFWTLITHVCVYSSPNWDSELDVPAKAWPLGLMGLCGWLLCRASPCKSLVMLTRIFIVISYVHRHHPWAGTLGHLSPSC